MENDGIKNNFSRRGFLGISSAALAGAGSLAVSSAMAQGNQQRTDRSATDPGPTNSALDTQNPDSAWPPTTDSKSLVQNFKYPFSFANKRTYKGGWSREVTVRELPVSKELAGVNMRLTAGGVRELHWHTADEWAIVLYGSARITSIDRDGKSFVADANKNDLWYFPSGIPHWIQGLDPDGTEFMLVFDDGKFSESETVLLSDSMAHLPPEVLSKTLVLLKRLSRICRGMSCLFFRLRFPDHWKRIRKQPQEHLGNRRKISLFARWRYHQRSARKAERCASWIRATSKRQRTLPWQWSRFIREGCANCTGTRMPTNGSTTSRAREE